MAESTLIVCRPCMTIGGSCPDMLPEERSERNQAGRGRYCYHVFGTLAEFRAHLDRHRRLLQR